MCSLIFIRPTPILGRPFRAISAELKFLKVDIYFLNLVIPLALLAFLAEISRKTHHINILKNKI